MVFITQKSSGNLHRVRIQSLKCFSGEVSIRGESEGWLSGCLGALQRLSAMTPSGYSDTLQTTLAGAAGLTDCSLPTTGNLCTGPTPLHHRPLPMYSPCLHIHPPPPPPLALSCNNRAAESIEMMPRVTTMYLQMSSAAHESRPLQSIIKCARRY